MVDRKKSEKAFYNPFKQLKGLSVSPSPKRTKRPKGPETKVPPAPAGDEADLFAQEMARLGLENKRQEPAAEAGDQEPSRGEAPPAETESEEELFLASLGEMDVTFKEEWPSDAEETRPAARRMKQLRQGKLVPEATLDLHGLTREEAREKVRYFLEDALYQGRRTVLIVTGRGLGSGGEPVLRGEIERYLSSSVRGWVSEWGRAPRRYGGEGALVVFLKSTEK